MMQGQRSIHEDASMRYRKLQALPVLLAASCCEGSEARHKEVKPNGSTSVVRHLLAIQYLPGKGNHVDSQLPQVCVQLPREPKEWTALIFSTSKRGEPRRWIALMSLTSTSKACARMSHLRQVVTPDIVIETRWLRSP